MLTLAAAVAEVITKGRSAQAACPFSIVLMPDKSSEALDCRAVRNDTGTLTPNQPASPLGGLRAMVCNMALPYRHAGHSNFQSFSNLYLSPIAHLGVLDYSWPHTDTCLECVGSI